MKRLALTVMLIVGLVPPAWAEVRAITATGEYRMGDNDTRADAKRMALQDAKRLALEQAGTYIEGITEVKNFALSRDELRAYIAGIVETTEHGASSTMEGQQQVVRVVVNCKIDTDVVARQIDALRKNEAVKAELLQARQEADRLRQELGTKTRELAAVTSKTEAETIAQARRKVLTGQDVNSLVAQAWVALGGPSKTLILGSSSIGGRRHARNLIEQALALDASNPDVHVITGGLLMEEGNLEGAIAEYRTAIRLKPDDANAHNSLGGALYLKGDLDGAIVEHRTAIRAKPDHALAHNNLGFMLHKKGDLEGAIVEYRTAIRLKPDDASFHHNLGIVLTAKGDVEGAIAEYRTAIRLKPDDAESRHSLGVALYEKNDLDGAIVEYRIAIHLMPDNAGFHASLGLAFKAKGQQVEAAREFREYLRLTPDTPANRPKIEKARAALREIE